MDENTAAKKQLEIARMLVKINSRLNIPGVVTINHKEEAFKIIVSLEEVEGTEQEKEEYNETARNGNSVESGRVVIGNGNFVVNGSGSPANKNTNGQIINKLGSELELAPWNKEGIDDMTKGSFSNLSEDEQAGCMERHNDEALEVVGCLGDCVVAVNNQEESGNPYENQWALQANSTREEMCMVQENGKNGPVHFEPIERGMLEVVQHQGPVNKKSLRVYKRRKKHRRDIRRIISEDVELQGESSDQSISDVDIEHRNSVIMKEAKAVWEVSEMLGLKFDKQREEMIGIFYNMEMEDRMELGLEV